MNLIALFSSLSLVVGTAAFQHAHPSIVVKSRTHSSSSALGASKTNAVEDGDNLTASRRSFFTSVATVAGVSALSTISPMVSNAAESATLTPYEDSDFNFRLQVPSTWEKSEQNLSGRRKGIFFTDPTSKDDTTGAIETLGFIAYTPIRDDFTSLSSFGSVDNVAQTTILPKGDLAGLDDASKMLSAVAKNNAYYFDYIATPVVPTESGAKMTKTLKPQHFRTIFTLLPLKGAAGLTLVTVTLQTTEERYGEMKGVFDGVVDSYGKM